MASPLVQRLLRRLDLSSDELRRVVPMATAYGLILSSLYLLKPARNALFLDRLGIGQLPYVLLLVALVGGVTAAIYGRYARTVRIDRLIQRTFLILIGFLLLFRFALPLGWGWLYYGFYIWVALYGLLTTSLVWLLANAVFTAREARKVFGFIGTGGIAGAIVGGIFTGWAVPILGTENLLFVCAGILGICIGLLRLTPPTFESSRRRRSHGKDKDEGGLAEILQSPLLRNLAFTAGLIATIAVIVDVQFNEIVDRVYVDKDEKTAFFGQFFAYLSAFGFLFQLVLTPLVLRALGVGVAVMILPLAMGLGSAAILLAPGLYAAIMAKGADGGFRHSVHKAATEVLFLPVPSSAKSQAKLFLDTTVDTTFTGLGALLVLLLTGPLALGHDKLSFVSVGLVGLVVVIAMRMRSAYVNAFRDALEGRKLSLDDLRVNLAEAGVISALLPSLDSENERQVIYVLDLLAGVKSRAVIDPVQALLHHDSAEVRRRALVVLQQQDTPVERSLLDPLLVDADAKVRLEAMVLYAATGPEAPEEILEGFLDGEDPRRLTAALGALARLGPAMTAARLDARRVQAFLANEGPEAPQIRAELARALAGNRDPELAEVFWRLAQDEDAGVIEAAIEGLGLNKCVDASSWLLDRLEHRAQRVPARRALVECGAAAVPPVAEALEDETRPFRVRLALPRLLGQIPHQDAVEALLRALPRVDAQLRPGVIRALARLRASYPELVFTKDVLLTAIERKGRDYYVHRQLRYALDGATEEARPHLQLLLRALREKEDRTLESLFLLLGLRYDPTDMTSAYQGVISPKKAIRASALEFLDNVLRKQIRELVLPALEAKSREQVVEQARTLFGETIETRTDAFVAILESDDPWLHACALFALDAEDRRRLAPLIEASTRHADPVVREAAEKVAVAAAGAA